MVKIISEATLQSWKRRIKGFWFEYSHNKIGMVGLGMLFFFVFLAVFAPFIAPYSEEDVRYQARWHADRHAMPDWIVIFPQFSDLPPQQVHLLNWAIEELPPPSVNVTMTSEGLIIRYNASITNSPDEVIINFNYSFNYPYRPMKVFSLDFSWDASPDQVVKTIVQTPFGPKPWGPQTGSMEYMIKIDLITPNGTSYPIWDQNWWKEKKAFATVAQPAFWSSNSSQFISMYSTLGELAEKLGYAYPDVYQVVADLFSTKGLYTFRLSLTVRPGRTEEGNLVPLTNATGYVHVTNGKFTVWGLRFGLLGTDGFNHDVFSQIIHGTRVSLIIGLSAAVFATVIGLLIGVTAGYVGGMVDESLMRIADIVICLPMLPVLLVFVAMFGYNTYFLVLMIAIFGWPGLSRVIRSQTLSLREMAFVESAIASGGTKSYIITRHITPNVLPTTLASMILRVPGAVILEAALSFIGMGDPNAATWGKILYFAQLSGAFSPSVMAWWVVLPPGLAITFLCLTFVFIGHAIDEIVNPRLRRRR